MTFGKLENILIYLQSLCHHYSGISKGKENLYFNSGRRNKTLVKAEVGNSEFPFLHN